MKKLRYETVRTRAKKNMLMWLRLFQSKARCMRTQRKAYGFWRHIRSNLTEREAARLLTAWSHAIGDEGPAELDDLAAKIKQRIEQA